MQFGLQARISVQQALLQAQSNPHGCLHHVAVLDLSKAYDKLDRARLLELVAENINSNGVGMVRATMGYTEGKDKRGSE